MSRTQGIASSPPVDGITRNCDLVMDTTSGSQEVGASVNCVRNPRTGAQGAVSGILLNQSAATYQILNGRPVVSIASGLGNGACIQYGIPIQADANVNANTPSAYQLRRGVTRFICTMAAASNQTPNNDVGMQWCIGGAGLQSLLPNAAAGTGAGKTGFGIWMLTSTGWYWGMKKGTDGAGALSDAIQIQADATILMETELRVYDSVPGGVAPSNYARCELWINGVLNLTRYWVNPAGIVTATLPTIGFALYPQIRNTSTGPATVSFGNPSLIHGPNDTGTI